MPTHGSVAAAVRKSKEANPGLYCKHPNCLWRLKPGEIAAGQLYCPRHEKGASEA